MKNVLTTSLLALIAATLLFSGCSKEDEEVRQEPAPSLSIDTVEFVLGSAQGSKLMTTFDVNVNWEASVSYVGNTKDWLTIMPNQGGAGDGWEMTMMADENASDIDRMAYLTINYEGETLRVIVSQVGNVNFITSHFDSRFAEVLQKKGYIADAKRITLSDVYMIRELNVNDADLSSLAGIEYFEDLTSLLCSSNQLTVLDLKKNAWLVSLDCRVNQLASLDISKNTALTYLGCDGNQLASLDLSMNTALTYLGCGNNQLTSLDLSKNMALASLWCANNQLTSLDVSKNTALTNYLSCAYNQLTYLDISNNTALNQLVCHHNPGIGGIFTVTAWFDNNSIPSGFDAGGNVYYQKAN